MKMQAASEQGGAAVWKMIYLARRNPALRPEEFAQAWREHSALGRQCRNVGQRVQAVAQCARVLSGPAQAAALSQDYDGVNLMVLAEREAGSAIWSDPETLAIMRPDEPRVFADYVRNFSLLCRQQVLRGCGSADVLPRQGQLILIGFVQRSDVWQGAAALPQACPPQWQGGALALASRIVCNTVDAQAPDGYGYRHVLEWWFDTLEQAQAAAASLDVSPSAQHGEFGWGEHVFMLTRVTHARP
ncbi:EthD domain-containing protein [Comamonas testosteroni]|uniref:EthD domain-containing protein n=1 Tax=Comamonas testosteroni TaxID=285 RepID=UPI0005B368B1|nr:EthD domain-containing protein [Comamonas testosteroni]